MKDEWQNLPPQIRQEIVNMTDSTEPPRSVEEVKAMLETTEKGGFRNSISNCLTVFQCDPLLSGAVAYNLLTDRTDILKPIGYKRPQNSPMTDTDMKYIRLYLEETYGLTSEKKIQDAAILAANENSYHPVREYLNSLTWDGTERIRSCLRHFLGAGEDEYTFQSLRLFLLGAIHRAFSPGCKFEVMLCLVGGQGAGKSTFFRLLAIKDEWFSDDLRKLDDDNVYRKLQGHWIIEMSEMIATANAKSIEEIKSFLSRQKEVYKIPYETLPPETMQLLRQYRAWQSGERLRLGGYYQDQGFLFAQDSGKPMHPDNVNTWLKNFSKRHGLPHINPHAFRHSMASLLYFNGVDSVSISKRLGHAQVSTTANIYAHVMEQADQKNADILANVFLKNG